MSTLGRTGFTLLAKTQKTYTRRDVIVALEAALMELQTQIATLRRVCVRLSSEVQSAEVADATDNPETQILAEENLVFSDGSLSERVNLGTFSGGNYDQDADSAAHLGEYLRRPVKIYSSTWAQGGGMIATIQPWSLFVNNVAIKNKLQNYSRISFRLHLKFLINGSPFHYGSLRACYAPLGGARAQYAATSDLIPFSQQPGLYLEPQNMSSAEMVLPFIWQHNWLSIPNNTDFLRMGTLNMLEYAPLQSANGATSGVTVIIYAWAEDVKLMGPTSYAAVQSDEYEDHSGTISGPASAVANVAARLSDVPVIGPFALATEIGARAVASIARLFGYSNPPVIDDVMPFQGKSFHAFANAETRMPIDKLSLDPKNEVTVSSSVCGVAESDPLVFKHLLRESYMLGTQWTGAQASGTLIWSAMVTPHFHDGLAPRNVVPMTYFGANFRFWRGSIIYKFRIIKTKFHKGRILISYDPHGDITTNPNTETTTFSRIVDIETEDSFEIAVPYKATQPLNQIPLLETWPTTASSAVDPVYTLGPDFHNGCITIRVQTNLTGPTTSANVAILSYSVPGDDFTFAAPKQLNVAYTTRDPAGVVQSGEIADIAQKTPSFDKHVGLITTGEVIPSMRPLLHRTHYSLTQVLGAGTPGAVGNFTATNHFYRVPPGVGRTAFGPAGYNRANPGASSYSYNFTTNNPLDWTLECFVGYRGSVNLHANVRADGNNVKTIGSVALERRYLPVIISATENQNGALQTAAVFGTNATSNLVRGLIANYQSGGGMSLTAPITQNALSINLPQYWPLRFYQAFHTSRDQDARSGNSIYDHVTLKTSFANSIVGATATGTGTVEIFSSAGVDFAPVFFLCTPRLWLTALPAASDT
uniref:Structural polyprotein n=1 Tax=Perth bee virus 5 TaxID=2201299 RepID=A0A2U8JQC6_9VIRU|nr:structural polyprotein [Perth bee virus 5]